MQRGSGTDLRPVCIDVMLMVCVRVTSSSRFAVVKGCLFFAYSGRVKTKMEGVR